VQLVFALLAKALALASSCACLGAIFTSLALAKNSVNRPYSPTLFLNVCHLPIELRNIDACIGAEPRARSSAGSLAPHGVLAL
jgi:hypothetical protein